MTHSTEGTMMLLRRRTWWESLCRVWPPYARRQDAELLEGLRYLVKHPEAPCVVGEDYIPDGYGTGAGQDTK